MNIYRQSPGRIRQKSLFVAKGQLASMSTMLNGLTGERGYGTYLTRHMRTSLTEALISVNYVLSIFNREVGWPCKDDQE